MEEKRIDGIKTAVKALKSKGVTAIKVELEAQLSRGRTRNRNTSPEYCDQCDEGWENCHECDGYGNIACPNEHCYYGTDDVTDEQCTTCHGQERVACPEHCDGGNVTCSECHGDYILNADEHDFSTESACQNWLVHRVAELSGDTLPEGRVANPARGVLPWLKFGYFYNDHSVDSEFTFTVSLDDEANIFKIPLVLQAFRELGEVVGQSFDVKGAGMHTALLFSEDYTYPHSEADQHGHSARLPEKKLQNFKKSMTQLLPALFFLASSNENSRPLGFRRPQISVDDYRDRERGMNTKYSAVNYRYGAFEFRVFDTCYENPQIILDNIVVIANCMKYFSTKYISPGIDKMMHNMQFGTDYNNKLERFYIHTTHLDALNTGLTKIKPSYMSIQQIKKQRNFNRTKRSLANIIEDKRKLAEIEYKEYVDRFNWQLKFRRQTYESQYMEDYISRLSDRELENMTEERVAEAVKGLVDDAVKEWKESHVQKAETYIKNRLDRFSRDNQGQYTLEFA